MAAGAGPAAAVFGVAGAASLVASAVLVTRIERIGERLGLSETALGLLAALAADAPEVTSSVTAVARGQHIVGAGVVLGSNLFNLAALLGLGALAAGRVLLHRRVVLLEGCVALWAAAIATALLAWGLAPAPALALLLAVVVPYAWLTALPPGNPGRAALAGRVQGWLADAVREEGEEVSGWAPPRPARARDAVEGAAALAVVLAASAALEQAGTSLGQRFGIPSIVVGGVLLAVVTSLPNAVAAVHLARRGRGAATLSEAMNSNTFNIAAGLLIPAVAAGSWQAAAGVRLVAYWYAGLAAMTLAIALWRRGLGRAAGSLVIGGYAAFVIALAVG